MPDASPADAPEGQTPPGDEGQKPDGDDTQGQAAPDGQQGRAYSESYVRQLRRESNGYRTRLTEVEAQLTTLTDRDKSEQQKLVERATAAEQAATDSATRLLRYEVAAEHGLDMAAAKFLTGSTREEIELRAEELAALLKDKAKPTASFDGGARQPVPDTRKPEDQHNDFLLEAMGRKPAT